MFAAYNWPCPASDLFFRLQASTMLVGNICQGCCFSFFIFKSIFSICWAKLIKQNLVFLLQLNNSAFSYFMMFRKIFARWVPKATTSIEAASALDWTSSFLNSHVSIVGLQSVKLMLKLVHNYPFRFGGLVVFHFALRACFLCVFVWSTEITNEFYLNSRVRCNIEFYENFLKIKQNAFFRLF